MASPRSLQSSPPLKKGGSLKIPLCLRGNQGDVFDFAFDFAFSFAFALNLGFHRQLKIPKQILRGFYA